MTSWKSKKWKGMLFCIFIVSSLLAACNNSENTATQVSNNQNQEERTDLEPQHGGVLEILMNINTRNIGYPPDPSATSTIYYYLPAIESLGRYNTDGIIEPHLAESWESDPEQKTVTFHLKEGIKFHDGTDFNAEALKWNIEQWIANKRTEVRVVESMDVLSEYSLRLNLSEWNSEVLEKVAYYVGVVSPTAVQQNGEEWAMNNPVGTGPFKLEKWEKDIIVSYVKNEDYWQEGKPYLDGITYKIFADANTAANVFKSGEGDIVLSLEAEDYFELERTGQYKFQNNIGVYGALGSGIIFDSVSPDSPFSDIRVRQAVAHAIDVETIIESVLRGQALGSNQYYSPGLRFYNEEVKGYEYNPERAKELLREAGYPDGFSANLMLSTLESDAYTAIQSYLADVGIDVKLRTVDFNQILAIYRSGEWDGMISLLWPVSPTSNFNTYFLEESLTFKDKVIRLPEIEQAIEAIGAATTDEERVARVKEMDKILVDEHALYFPMYAHVSTQGMRLNVHNNYMLKINSYDYLPEEIWLEQ